MNTNVVLVIGWSIMILILSLMPSSSFSEISLDSALQLDKVAHIFLYAIYSFIIAKYLISESKSKMTIYLTALFVSIAYGILMEVLQYYLSPTRFFDLLDIIANIIGALTGLLIMKIKF